MGKAGVGAFSAGKLEGPANLSRLQFQKKVNIERPTSNIECGIGNDREISAEAGLSGPSWIFAFYSMLDVRCSMLDVHFSKQFSAYASTPPSPSWGRGSLRCRLGRVKRNPTKGLFHIFKNPSQPPFTKGRGLVEKRL
jgi:hypothetical protein